MVELPAFVRIPPMVRMLPVLKPFRVLPASRVTVLTVFVVKLGLEAYGGDD